MNEGYQPFYIHAHISVTRKCVIWRPRTDLKKVLLFDLNTNLLTLKDFIFDVVGFRGLRQSIIRNTEPIEHLVKLIF